MSGTLEQRVNALEQAIAGLQGSEALQPNYLTVSPTGQVGANFTGIIKALGLTIAAYIGATVPNVPNQAQWVDASGASVGWVAGQQNPVTFRNFLRLASIGTLLGNNSTVTVGSQDNAGNTGALISTNYSSAGNPSGFVTAQAGATAVDVIDSNGASSFVFNGVGGALGIYVVQVELDFAANSFSGVNVVGHTLGRIPKAVLLTRNVGGSGDGYPLGAVSFGWSNTNVNVQAVDFVGSAITLSSFWSCLIIG